MGRARRRGRFERVRGVLQVHAAGRRGRHRPPGHQVRLRPGEPGPAPRRRSPPHTRDGSWLADTRRAAGGRGGLGRPRGKRRLAEALRCLSGEQASNGWRRCPAGTRVYPTCFVRPLSTVSVADEGSEGLPVTYPPLSCRRRRLDGPLEALPVGPGGRCALPAGRQRAVLGLWRGTVSARVGGGMRSESLFASSVNHFCGANEARGRTAGADVR